MSAIVGVRGVVATHDAVIAHQGGWDEILLIGVPILLIVGALWVAKRRVEASSSREHVSGVPEADAAEPPHRSRERP